MPIKPHLKQNLNTIWHLEWKRKIPSYWLQKIANISRLAIQAKENISTPTNQQLHKNKHVSYKLKQTRIFKKATWLKSNSDGRTMTKECITFSSSRVKPLPALDFMLYLRVWHCTMGRRRPAVGRGNIFTAFFWRAAYRIRKLSVSMRKIRGELYITSG
jgi:hypothetical protein